MILTLQNLLGAHSLLFMTDLSYALVLQYLKEPFSLGSFEFSKEKGLACRVEFQNLCSPEALTAPREQSRALICRWTSLQSSNVQLDRSGPAQSRAERPEPGFRSERSLVSLCFWSFLFLFKCLILFRAFLSNLNPCFQPRSVCCIAKSSPSGVFPHSLTDCVSFLLRFY